MAFATLSVEGGFKLWRSYSSRVYFTIYKNCFSPTAYDSPKLLRCVTAAWRVRELSQNRNRNVFGYNSIVSLVGVKGAQQRTFSHCGKPTYMHRAIDLGRTNTFSIRSARPSSTCWHCVTRGKRIRNFSGNKNTEEKKKLSCSFKFPSSRKESSLSITTFI